MAIEGHTGRRRRSDGERSRQAILEAAGKRATMQGLDGLTIGSLAEEIGMSKSGLYAHFGSKEELQLATVAAAERVFEDDVVVPAQAAEPGLPRLDALCEGFMAHVQSGVFPGGCFFTSVMAEFDTRPGPVRDRVAMYVINWVGGIRAEAIEAQRQGQIAADADVDQLTFEIQAALIMANTLWVLTQDPSAFDRARTAVGSRIALARTH